MAGLVEKRYGQALFELVLESEHPDEREEEIRIVSASLEEDDALIDVLRHPKLNVDDKIKMVESIFTDKVSQDLIGFLVLAIQKKRQENIVDILNYTLQKLDEEKGYVNAYVTSAKPLSEEDGARLKEKLESTTKKKITLITEVDESLIGGLTVRIHDRIVDHSIKSSLQRMARTLYDAKV